MSLLSAALSLVTHGGVAEAKRWFDTVRDPHEQVRESADSWQRFREQLPAAAERQSFSPDAARQFTDGMEQLADHPSELMVARLHANRSDLPDLYTAATQGGGEFDESAAAGAFGGSVAGAFDGVASGVGGRFDRLHRDPALAAQVQGALGWSPEHYESQLGPYLDNWWGAGWEQHPAEHKSAWLDQLVSGVNPAPAP
ncbi:MAG TPA: hypothetical protein VFW65_06755 [Pseudonocardiaceae bacterium]|nr:hypothetical protein [Pseudonocardiaceae bacterium]